ncbi:hypothetical protein KGQ34_00385 [Patescibacteria group bacterium]|nr:hypothetical protein [Patescibacteria group bacterium]
MSVVFATAMVFIVASTYEVSDAQNGGVLKGSVRYVGNPPEQKQVDVTKDAGICAQDLKSEDLIVGPDRGIANVVIMLTFEKGRNENWKKVPPGKMVLNQKGCRFNPHVMVVPAGADVEVLNPDGILHNFHSKSVKNFPVNIAMPKFKKVITVRFPKPEIVEVVCDAHNWMAGWLIVSEHPYVAITDAHGNFEIKASPAGTYKVEIWHEKLGKEVKTVGVKAGQTVVMDLERK